jgi:dipeptidyl aminopeptidase/acylaminoacyl peptidase
MLLADLVLAAGLTAAHTAASDGLLLARNSYDFPAWDDAVADTDVERYATEEEYAAAVGGDGVLEKLRYRSGELAVVAYFFHPRASEPARRPVVVFNRGSYVRDDVAPELVTTFRRLADEGFAVVAPLYRGSDGGEGHDDMGGADLADLMNVLPLLDELPGLDVRNVFLYGESRGGMMVFQALRAGFRARAAATFGAFTDLEDLIATNGDAAARAIWPDFAARKDEILETRSALRWPAELRAPLLLMHGSADGSVPPTQTLRLATELARADRDFGLIVFEGDGHTLFEHRIERDRAVAAFFREHLAE